MSRKNDVVISPPGKKVSFTYGYNGRDILSDLKYTPKSDLLLAEELQISLSSNFQPLLGSNLFKLGVLASAAFDVPALGANKAFGYQIWSGTDPVKLSFTVSLKRVDNAWKDVVLPARELMKLPLPQEATLKAGATEIEGNLLAPGPSFLDVLNDNVKIRGIGLIDYAGSSTQSENGKGSGYKSKRLSMSIGDFIFMDYIIVSRVEPTFSTEVDESGCPVYANLAIDVSSVYTATTNSIDNMLPKTENII